MPAEFQKFTPQQYQNFFNKKATEAQCLIDNLPNKNGKDFTSTALAISGIISQFQSRIKQITRSEKGLREVAEKAEEQLLLLKVNLFLIDYKIILDNLKIIPDEKPRSRDTRKVVSRYKASCLEKISEITNSVVENSEKEMILERLKAALVEIESL